MNRFNPSNRQRRSICCKELESIRGLFNEKEKELSVALAKVDALTRQLEELKNGNTANSYNIVSAAANGLTGSYSLNKSKFNAELEKLRQELLNRTKLNEQINDEMVTKKRMIDQRTVELSSIDQRINELQSRLNRKRSLNQQSFAQMQNHLIKNEESSQNNNFNNNCFNDENTLTNGKPVTKTTIRRSIGVGQPYKFTYLRPLNAVEPLQRQVKSAANLVKDGNQNNSIQTTKYADCDKRSVNGHNQASNVENRLDEPKKPNRNKLSDYSENQTDPTCKQNNLNDLNIKNIYKDHHQCSSNNHNDENQSNSVQKTTASLKSNLNNNTNVLSKPISDQCEFSTVEENCNTNNVPSYNSSQSFHNFNNDQNISQMFHKANNESIASGKLNNKNANLLKHSPDKSNDFNHIEKEKFNNKLIRDLSDQKFDNIINNTAKYLILDSYSQKDLNDENALKLNKNHHLPASLSASSSASSSDFISSSSSNTSTFNSSFHQLQPTLLSNSSYRFSDNSAQKNNHGIEKGYVFKSIQQLQQQNSSIQNGNLSNDKLNQSDNSDNNENQDTQNYNSICNKNTSESINNENLNEAKNCETITTVNELVNNAANPFKNNKSQNDIIENNEANTSTNNCSTEFKLNNSRFNFDTEVKSDIESEDWFKKRRPLVVNAEIEQHFEIMNNNDLNNEQLNYKQIETETDDKNILTLNINEEVIKEEEDLNNEVRSFESSPICSDEIDDGKIQFRSVIRNMMCKNSGSCSDKSSSMSEENTDDDEENSVDCKAVVNEIPLKAAVKAVSKVDNQENSSSKDLHIKQFNYINGDISNKNSFIKNSFENKSDDISMNSSYETSSDDKEEDDVNNENELNTKNNIENSVIRNNEGNENLKRTKSNLKKSFGINKRRVSFDPLALLLDAALEGELELVKKTAAQVPNPSASSEGITALHNAICAGYIDIVKYLVEIGCDVNAQDYDGWTPLHCAASCNNLIMVKYLVEHGACIFAVTLSDHETPAQKCEEMEDGYQGCSQYLYSMQEKLGVLNGGHVYAVYDYTAQQNDELSFKCGELLRIISRSDESETEWWWATNNHQQGYVPRNLLSVYPRVSAKTK